MKPITLDHLEPDVERFITERTLQTKSTPEQVVTELIRDAVRRVPARNEKIGDALDDFVGGWSEEEASRIEQASTACRKIDHELWK